MGRSYGAYTLHANRLLQMVGSYGAGKHIPGMPIPLRQLPAPPLSLKKLRCARREKPELLELDKMKQPCLRFMP